MPSFPGPWGISGNFGIGPRRRCATHTKLSISHLLYTHAICQEPLCQATDATARIRYLAGSYRELSYRSERDLMQLIQQHQDHAITQMLSSLTKNLALTPPPPEYWQEDLQTIIDCHRERLASEMPPRLNQLPRHVTEERQTNWVREQFERFADSMDRWPKLWSYALAQAPVWHAKIRER